MELSDGTVMDLDTTGLFYSSVACEEHPGTFSVGVYLNEDINVEILTEAVRNLYKRLPHFNVILVEQDNMNKNMKVEKEVLPQQDKRKFCSYFKKGEVTSRVVYGKNYFVMEVLHSVCDGGTLTKAVKALTIEYFNLSGVKTPYQEISLDDEFEMDEIENAVQKYAKKADLNSKNKDSSVYRLKKEKTSSYKKTFNFNVDEIRLKSKEKGITITEYLIYRMVLAFDKERKLNSDNHPVCINIPLDCRKYYPTKTLRNFVIAFNVIVDKWSSDEDLLNQIHQQMTSVGKEYVQNYLDKYALVGKLVSDKSYEETISNFLAFEKVGGGSSMTSVLSNVGLVRFDEKIQGRINHMEFTLCPEENCPYQFACITCGKTLSLTVTVNIKDETCLDNIINNI